MKLIVGLGNPGKKYAHTRHNVGFDVVDILARRWGACFRRNFLVAAETAKVQPEGLGDVLLVKPQAWMNVSGPPVEALMRRKGSKPEDVIVVVDDADLALGLLRVRKRGSAGGHNGLKSLLAALGTDSFPRVRVGIGRSDATELVDHVLAPFAREERKMVDDAIERAADAVVCLMKDGVESAMNAFNGAAQTM